MGVPWDQQPHPRQLEFMAACQQLMNERLQTEEYAAWFSSHQQLLHQTPGLSELSVQFPDIITDLGLLDGSEQQPLFAFLEQTGVARYPPERAALAHDLISHVWRLGQLQAQSMWSCMQDVVQHYQQRLQEQDQEIEQLQQQLCERQRHLAVLRAAGPVAAQYALDNAVELDRLQFVADRVGRFGHHSVADLQQEADKRYPQPVPVAARGPNVSPSEVAPPVLSESLRRRLAYHPAAGEGAPSTGVGSVPMDDRQEESGPVAQPEQRRRSKVALPCLRASSAQVSFSSAETTSAEEAVPAAAVGDASGRARRKKHKHKRERRPAERPVPAAKRRRQAVVPAEPRFPPGYDGHSSGSARKSRKSRHRHRTADSGQ